MFSKYFYLSCKKIIIFFILLFVIILTFYLYPFFAYNFHAVVPSQAYRSAQLPIAKLTVIIKKFHIRSILNLRNKHPHKQWYRLEAVLAKKRHIKFYNISLSSHRLPNKIQLRRLVHITQHAPRPMLIHCRWGADRSGLAAAIFMLLQNKSLKIAYKQLSWYYLVLSSHSVGKLVLPYYRAWLRQHHLHSTTTHFLQWVDSKYPFKKLM